MKIEENLNNPLVSVVVITYNSSQYVIETLESIKNQTFQNIELIVSDDCSTDKTVTICEKWIEDNKERFVRTEIVTTPVNTGIPANCNRGAKKANGEWLNVIAGDDFLCPDCLKDNLLFIDSNPNIKVLFSFMKQYIDTFHEANYFRTLPQVFPDFLFGENITVNKQYSLMLENDRIAYTPTYFIKKTALSDVSYYDERFKKIEDYSLWLKLLRNGDRLYFMPKVTVLQRIHNQNTFTSREHYLIHPSFTEREKFRKVIVYPYIHWLHALSFRHKYLMSFIVIYVLQNKFSKINRFISDTLLVRINPFQWIIRIFKISIV